LPPEKDKPFFGPPKPDDAKKPASSPKKTLKKSAPAPTIADKNPFIKTINRQGVKTPFAEEKYVQPFNETSKTRYRRSVDRKSLEGPADINEATLNPESWKQKETFKNDVILVQDMTAFDKKVFGFVTDGDLKNIPPEMWNHPEFMSAWEARAKYRANLVTKLQQGTQRKGELYATAQEMESNTRAGNIAANLSTEELDSVRDTNNTSEFGGIPFYSLVEQGAKGFRDYRLGKGIPIPVQNKETGKWEMGTSEGIGPKFGDSPLSMYKPGMGTPIPKFNDQTGKWEMVPYEGFGLDFSETQEVGNKVASGFGKDPNMASTKSDPEIILDSLLAVTPIIGNPGYTAARLLNPGMSDAETDDNAKALGLAFDFTTQMVGAFKPAGLFRGARVAGAAKAAPTVKQLLLGAGLSIKSAVTTSNLIKTGGRFALTDLPGYAKMLSDADGNAEEALKMFAASTFGEFGNLGKILDSDVPLSQKIQTVTAVVGSLLLGLGAYHGVSSGKRAITNKFRKPSDDQAVFTYASNVLNEAGINITFRKPAPPEAPPGVTFRSAAKPEVDPEAPPIVPSEAKSFDDPSVDPNYRGPWQALPKPDGYAPEPSQGYPFDIIDNSPARDADGNIIQDLTPGRVAPPEERAIMGDPLPEPEPTPEAPQIETSPQETAIPVAANPDEINVGAMEKSAPRWLKLASPRTSWGGELVFESYVDQAVYMATNSKNPSQKAMDWLIENGFTREEVIELGSRIANRVDNDESLFSSGFGKVPKLITSESGIIKRLEPSARTPEVEPVADTQPAPDPRLPRQGAAMQPRYQGVRIEFESGIDEAIYHLRYDLKQGSKTAKIYQSWLNGLGFDDASIESRGKVILAKLKNIYDTGPRGTKDTINGLLKLPSSAPEVIPSTKKTLTKATKAPAKVKIEGMEGLPVAKGSKFIIGTESPDGSTVTALRNARKESSPLRPGEVMVDRDGNVIRREEGTSPLDESAVAWQKAMDAFMKTPPSGPAGAGLGGFTPEFIAGLRDLAKASLDYGFRYAEHFVKEAFIAAERNGWFDIYDRAEFMEVAKKAFDDAVEPFRQRYREDYAKYEQEENQRFEDYKAKELEDYKKYEESVIRDMTRENKDVEAYAREVYESEGMSKLDAAKAAKEYARKELDSAVESLKSHRPSGYVGAGMGAFDGEYIVKLGKLADAAIKYGIHSFDVFIKQALAGRGDDISEADFTLVAKKAYEKAYNKAKKKRPDLIVDLGEPITADQQFKLDIADVADAADQLDDAPFGTPGATGTTVATGGTGMNNSPFTHNTVLTQPPIQAPPIQPPPIQPGAPNAPAGEIKIMGHRADGMFNHLTFLQSQVDAVTGETTRTGALEQVFGDDGRAISDAFFRAGKRGRKYSEEFILDLVDVIDIMKELQSDVKRNLKKADWQKVQEDFVNLIEMTPDERRAYFQSLAPTDPQAPILKRALAKHDGLMDKAKRFIVEGKLFDGSIRIEDPNNPNKILHPSVVMKDPVLFQQAMDRWGINTRGYYHHSFMGNVSVYTAVTDANGVTTYHPITPDANNFRTYAEAEKAARDYFRANPNETVVVKGRDYFSEPEAFKPTEVGRSKLFKMGSDLSKNLAQELVNSGLYDFLDNSGQVGVNVSDIIKAELGVLTTPGVALDAMKGVVEMTRPKKKMHTSFMGRDTSKGDLGRLGYSKDYTAVMGKYLRGVARARNLTEMSFEIAPFVENIKRDPKLVDPAKALDGIIEDIWGKQSRSDKFFSKLAVWSGLDRKVNDHTQLATALTNYIRGGQYLLRLKYNPRAWLLNSIQSLMLIPDIGIKAYSRAVWEAQRSVRKKDGAWEMLRKEGALQGAIFGDELDLVKTLSRKTDVHANISEWNRLIGYIAGRNKAVEGLPFDVVDANGKVTRVTGLTYDQVTADPKLKAQYDVWADRVHDNGLQWMARTEGDASTFNKQSWARGPAGGTLTQFKSFTVHQLRDIFQPQTHEINNPGKYMSRVTKKLTVLGLIGGVRGMTGMFSAKGLFMTAAIIRVLDKIAPEMDDEVKDGIANFIYRGIPSLAGWDLSGSVSLVDTFGDNLQEKAYNFVGGPALGTLAQMTDKFMQGKPFMGWNGDPSVIDGATPYWRMITSGFGEPEINEGRGKGKDMAWFERLGAALNIPALRQSEVYDERERKFLRKRVPGADKVLKEKRW
jgi:hypothetical protein